MTKNVADFFIAGAIGLLGWFFGGLDGFMHVFRQRTLKQLMTDLSLKVVFEKD